MDTMKKLKELIEQNAEELGISKLHVSYSLPNGKQKQRVVAIQLLNEFESQLAANKCTLIEIKIVEAK